MMKYFSGAIRMIMIPLALISFFQSCSSGDEYIAITGFAQGGTYSVKLNMTTGNGRVAKSPESIKADMDSILTALDNSVSGYNKGSLLSRFNAGETIRPDSFFVEIYRRSYDFYEETGTAVDVAAGPLFDAWGFGFTSGSMPSDEEVESLIENIGMGRLQRDILSATGEDGTLSSSDLLLPGTSPVAPKLNFNAVAQGYSCDVIASYLHSLGIKDMLVDIGGEIYTEGKNPSGKNWTLGIDKPYDGNETPGEALQALFSAPETPCGIVTSGNYRKFYMRDGRKYAHTVDPRTGYPVSHSLLSATVVTEGDAAAADAYATYCMVIGLEKAREFIEGRTGVEGFLVYEEDGAMKTWASSGFPVSEVRSGN